MSQDYTTADLPAMPAIYNPDAAKAGFGENGRAWEGQAREDAGQYRGTRPTPAENRRNAIEEGHQSVAQDTIVGPNGFSGFAGESGYAHYGHGGVKSYEKADDESDIQRNDTNAKNFFGDFLGMGDDPLKFASEDKAKSINGSSGQQGSNPAMTDYHKLQDEYGGVY